ncbi:MAG: ComEC/Rec2 family competence protein [Clostridiales bacterium]|nr:ComEC/Rec2 family competence protein [Clostridiales bacterium]
MSINSSVNRPLIPIGAAMFISLIVFGFFGFFSAVIVFGLGFIVFFLSLLIFRKGKSLTLGSAVRCCCYGMMISATLFCLKTVIAYNPAAAYVNDEVHAITGTVTDYEENYDRFYYTLKTSEIDGAEEEINIRVMSYYFIDAEIDDQMSFNDLTLYTLGSSDSSVKQYKANGVYIGGYGSDVFSVEKAERHSLNYYFEELRQYISSVLHTYLPEDISAAAIAMLIGDKSELDDELSLNFRYTGIAHLLAVSGFHLSLWVFFINAFFRYFAFKKRKLGFALAIVFVLFYMTLTGFTRSVMRAGIMMIVMLLGKIIRDEAESLNSLFLALIILLISNPFSAESISLQMSFFSTLGLVLLSDAIFITKDDLKDLIKTVNGRRLFRAVYSTVMVSIIACLFTMPVCIYQFGYFSLVSPLTNLLTNFCAELFIFFSGMGVILSAFEFLAKPMFLAAYYLGKYVVFITSEIAEWQGIIVRVKTAALFAFFLTAVAVTIVIISVFLAKGKRKYVRRTLYAFFAVIVMFSVVYNNYDNGSVEISAENVGSGTTVILSYKGKTCVIGCGGSSYREYSVINSLNESNSGKIDYLLIPSKNSAENIYADTLLKSYDNDIIVFSQEAYLSGVFEDIPESAEISDESETYIVDDLTISTLTNDYFCGARISTENFECTVVFKPLSDFSYAPDSWSQGDLLVIKSKVTDEAAKGFDTVFVSTSFDYEYEDEKIYTTANSGELELRVSPLGKISVTEEK